MASNLRLDGNRIAQIDLVFLKHFPNLKVLNLNAEQLVHCVYGFFTSNVGVDTDANYNGHAHANVNQNAKHKTNDNVK